MNFANFTVFINYAAEDRLVAQELSAMLRSKGLTPWLDVEKLLPGDNWKEEIIRAIRTCNVFIALLSSNSVTKRGFVQKEIREALKVLEIMPPGEIFLIPVRLDNCQPTHPDIIEKHWVDFFPTKKPGVDKLIETLSRAASQLTLSTRPSKPNLSRGTLSPVQSIEKLLMYILEVWAGADPGCDNNRIADHSVEIASKMGWSGEKLVNLRVGAALRDIGKLMIPNEILKKCGRLSPEEFEILRYHTIRGEEILFKAGLHDACRIARSPWCGKIPSAL